MSERWEHCLLIATHNKETLTKECRKFIQNLANYGKVLGGFTKEFMNQNFCQKMLEKEFFFAKNHIFQSF